ncbi:MAG: NADPH:quinone oxidoreductase family protein [Leptospiraceae bacterium]|nr:NADPH:quinone oxidoreductase family protein [Leptospiraceae bacterium]MCK6380345.1 NADPH:quinone oxidoreductase family protein [Leptospiraceae bacterium]NUM40868.1 NADPH:quinone oxidoreductase family protein [Leptospiraceae bacterium]
MKAYFVDKWCEPEELQFKEVPDPKPEKDQVVVDIRACGMNFPDMLLIQGKYQIRPTRPFIPGTEISGVVSALGENVNNFKIGDRVMGLSWLGGYAEKIAIPVKNLFVIPEKMSFEEAAGFNVTYQSSYFAVVVRGKLQKNETLLVHAGAGGIGTAAIQIGKAIGSKVYATVGSDEKIEIAKKAGADLVLNYSDSMWSKKLRKEYGGVDVVIDPVGGEIFNKTILSVNFEGRIVVVGFTSGTIPKVPTNLLLLGNISVVGLFWNLYQDNHPMKIQGAMNDLIAWYNEGKIKPMISKSVPLIDAPKALMDIGTRKSYGKVVLIP